MNAILRVLCVTLSLLAGAGLAGAGPAAAQGSEIADLATRPGVTVRILALMPAGNPRAVVVLLPGSEGRSDIPDHVGPDWMRSGSFLVRASPLFRERGVAAIIVDPPSDRRAGLTIAFRQSTAHAEDLAVVIAEARRRARGAPVWLMAHSSGAMSATNAAVRLAGPRGPDGLVLASSVAYPLGSPPPGARAGVVPGVAAIRVPTLLLNNRSDGCTPLGSAQALRAALTGAPRAELLVFAATPAPGARRCGRFAAHGFNGVEDEAVRAVVAWIERR